MRRVLVTARWPVGGIRTFLKYVYARLDAGTIELAFALPDVDESRQLQHDLHDLVATWHWLPAETLQYFRQLRRLVNTLEFDLLHSHGFTSLLAATAAGMRCPHITTVHDVLLEQQLSGVKGALRKASLRWALSRTDAIHTVSMACADNLVEMLELDETVLRRVEVIRNGIDTETFRTATTSSLRESLNLPPDTLLVGFFGRFMNQKGFRYVVDAVERLHESGSRPVKVVCVGSGGYKARELRDIDARGLSDHFSFVDFVPHVGGLMKSVDVVLMPSLWEACGLVAMEAMVAGAPLVASDIPALIELGEGSPTQFVEVGNAEAIADAIADLDIHAKRSASADYAEVAARRFTVDVTARELGRLYRRLLTADDSQARRFRASERDSG